MFTKATLQKIASLLKLKEEDVLAANADTAEKDLEFPENLVVMSADEQATRESNLKKKYLEEGKAASIEMFIKDQKNSLGLEFEGKDPIKFLEAYSAKVLADAKVTPNEALAEKDKTINALKQNITTLENEKKNIEKQVSTVKMEGEIMRALPTNLNGVEPEEVLASMRLKGYDFLLEDGKVVATKNGEKVADTQLNPLPVADVIKGYAAERKWLTDDAGGDDKSGRGGASSKNKGKHTNAPTSLSEAEKSWVEQGKNLGTSDFTRYVDGLVKENPNFDMQMNEPK